MLPKLDELISNSELGFKEQEKLKEEERVRSLEKLQIEHEKKQREYEQAITAGTELHLLKLSKNIQEANKQGKFTCKVSVLRNYGNEQYFEQIIHNLIQEVNKIGCKITSGVRAEPRQELEFYGGEGNYRSVDAENAYYTDIILDWSK